MPQTHSSIPTAGFFPHAFPRDPVEVNIFSEHILLGQIIEPLIEAGMDGKIVPAVASHWEVSQDGREISFFIRAGVKFSNGRKVVAEDARYSLQRHIDSANSQSKAYLKRVKAIAAVSDSELRLVLESPYIAIFKALSRDQLGIIPSGWKMDRSSKEPFLGTGPYRAIKDRNGWRLTKNRQYRTPEAIQIPEWKLIFSDTPVQSEVIPDLVPAMRAEYASELKTTREKMTADHYMIEAIPGFAQTSAWWYPHGRSFSDISRKRLGMHAVRAFIAARVKELGLVPATGIIPEGIAGSITREQVLSAEISTFENRESQTTDERSSRTFSIAVSSSEFPVMQSPSLKAEIEARFNVALDIFSFEHAQLQFMVEQKPDILMTSYAGAFHDPEGFLTVAASFLRSDLPRIFGDVFPLYVEVSTDQDWSHRVGKYQELNRVTQDKFIVVPGWKLPMTRIRNKSISIDDVEARFTAKLIDAKYET